jgi:hypothetical protein
MTALNVTRLVSEAGVPSSDTFVWVSLCGVGFPLAHMSDVRGIRGPWNLSPLNLPIA